MIIHGTNSFYLSLSLSSWAKVLLLCCCCALVMIATAIRRLINKKAASCNAVAIKRMKRPSITVRGSLSPSLFLPLLCSRWICMRERRFSCVRFYTPAKVNGKKKRRRKRKRERDEPEARIRSSLHTLAIKKEQREREGEREESAKKAKSLFCVLCRHV